jgi:hypothetical protein
MRQKTLSKLLTLLAAFYLIGFIVEVIAVSYIALFIHGLLL